MSKDPGQPPKISRRIFVSGVGAGIATVVAKGALGLPSRSGRKTLPPSGPECCTLSLNGNWLFGGKLTEESTAAQFNDSAFARVSLPHCVNQLSWQKWDPEQWETLWVYRRHFIVPRELSKRRLFLKFDGVMIGATPYLNGHALSQHLGGYLPFNYEITNLLAREDNVLAVAVDSRWSNVPPEGSPRGARAVDYYLPGGILRSVSLQAWPQIFVADVFAKPVDVLDAKRRVELKCTLDAAVLPRQELKIEAALMDGGRTLARTAQGVHIEHAGPSDVDLTLTNLGDVRLWDNENPHLYVVRVTLSMNGRAVHERRIRIGFRDARFEVDGFFLNGQRLRIFGLNRHELFPYVGYAMPDRVMRRDAEILRREFNCNFTRCSHYPQSEAFLDACDELGLMVWEEPPGWGYLGDDAWQELLFRDVGNMIRRDRNHPSIVIWAVRANETKNDPALYVRTRELAKALDGSRPTSGSMTPGSRKNWEQEWHQDVFAFDDYHAEPDGTVGIDPPLPGVPYMLSEAVGQFNYATGKRFDAFYRRSGDITLQVAQALRHAQAHSRAANFPRICGVVAWCAFEYGSPANSHDGVKNPGVADVFRIPKLGASFYLAQVDAAVRPVIEPDFYWDFGPQTPSGPGKRAAIFSNGDRLEVFINGQRLAALQPDRENFPNIKYPPFFADFSSLGAEKPELRIESYVGEKLALSRSFSADPSHDQLWLRADDKELIANGSDATRLAFRAVDKFGAQRPFVAGEVTLHITGPGVIVGDNPFQWEASGGVGAVWIKTLASQTGRITVTASHVTLGTRSVAIEVQPNTSPQVD
jgi:beta-galactosidase